MMESEIAPIDEELQSLAHLVTRQHAIVLCCAHSVAELVEEVARNLGGLGFDVDVVCGAEARSALLGRYERRDEPTIYVVCVQGTLKEQVLKPLRQALATHGGPNQHLFVAVLDLALPLAMVGQIRRFAEALERPAGRGLGGLNERRQWRENLGPGGAERMPTRAYRAVDVLERSGSHPVVGATVAARTGPQAVIGSARPTKLGATAKYRAVTGQLPAVSEESDPSPETSSSRRRRKTHAPKVRVKPIAPARGRRAGARDVMKEDTGAGDAAAERDAEAIAAAIERAASEELEANADEAALREHVPPADIDASMVASWGLDEQPTAVRPRQSDAAIAAAGSGDTVVAPPPLPGSTRRETVLYTETADDAVLLTQEPEGTDPASATTRGNTVIGQPPTRFRATPVSMPAQRGDTAVGTVVPPPGSRGETVAATPRGETSSTARGETVVARVTLVPSSPPASSDASATARGNTVIPSSSEVIATPTARGETVVAPPRSEGSTPTARGETVVAPPRSERSTPTARGETVVAPARSERSTPTARGETVVAPPPSEGSTPTARGETVVAPARSEGSTSTARGMTVVPDGAAPVRESPTARGETVVPGDNASATARSETVVPGAAAPSLASPTARGETVLLDATPSRESPTARGETELLGAAALSRESPTARGETELLTAVARDVPDAAARPSQVREARPAASIVAPEAAPAADPIFEPRRRSRWPLALAATAIAGAIVLIWSTGALERLRGAPTPAPVAASTTLPEPPVATREPADPAAHAAVNPARARADARTPAEIPEPTAVEPTVPPVEPTPTVSPSEPAAKPEPTAAETPTPEPTAAETPTPVPLPAEAEPDPIGVPSEGRIDPALATAISQRRIRLTEDLYVTSLRNDATTWPAARALCEALELDGVRGFRLPFRRELQAIDVAGYLRVAPHWSRTVPDDDHDAAYVLHPSTGQLTVWYKQESAAVVCVRSR
jgi:hypothetical protein